MSLPDLSDSLLVPMNIQAAVVNRPVLAGVAFVDGGYNYENLTTYLSPAPDPFEAGDKPPQGVHLHWELPAAFRHGAQGNAASQPDYPLVPNRWLVLRYWPGQTADVRRSKAWVVLSDHTGSDGHNSYIMPYGPLQGQATRLGKAVTLSDFTEPGNQLFLTAVAPGNISFAAFRPNVKNVFSFLDDGTDDAGNALLTHPGETIVFSYVVVGWFSDPSRDPLHGLSGVGAWADAMAAQQWITTPFPFRVAGASPPQKAFGLQGYGDVSAQFPKGQSLKIADSSGNDGDYVIADDPVYDPNIDHLTLRVDRAMPSALADGRVLPPRAPATWPTRTLVHGLLYDLKWQNDAIPERPNSSPQDVARNVRLAAGNSSVDALAAMMVAEAMADEGADPTQALAQAYALEAFQAGMLSTLDEPDGDAQLNMRLRQQWFGAAGGGVLWSLVANSAVDGQAKPDRTQQTWLANLNCLQRGCDREARILSTMQERLYMNWWRVQRITTGYTPPNLDQIWSRIEAVITGALPVEAAAVKAQQANVAAWAARVSALLAAPPSYDENGTTVAIQTPQAPTPPRALKLESSRMGRFFRPGDPVLLISGLGASQSQNAPDQSGTTIARCRLGRDHISALTVSPTTISLDRVATLAAAPASSTLPSAVLNAAAVLGAEGLLLDPDNADLIATVTSASAAAIAGAIRSGRDFTGQAPVPWAAVPWLQAWQPLYLDWQITWYPTLTAPSTKAGNGPQWAFDRDNWVFNGIDYVWVGGDVTNPYTGPAAIGYAITAASPAQATITLGGAGDLGFAFAASAEFVVTGATALDGSYTVNECAVVGDDFVITVDSVPSDIGDGTATLQVLSGSELSFAGRTFLTPQATFNFRERLEQYIRTQKQGGHDIAILDQAAHLLDIIGGARYGIQAANARAKSFTIGSTVDLTHLFAPGTTCYVAEAEANDGAFTVVSTVFDEAGQTFVVTVQEVVVDAGPDGVLIPQPAGWDLLSQSLSGMTEQLVMRSLQPNAMARGPVGQDTYDALVGDGSQRVPLLTMGDTVSPAGGTPSPYFFPIRGGFLALRRLQLIDRFGQSLNLLYANSNAQFSDPPNLWQTFSPICSSWLRTPAGGKVTNPQRLLRLPPRAGSPLRLDFTFVSAPDSPDGPIPEGVDVGLLDGANPVCGWVLPNHLDQGLLIYDRAGEAQGELALSHRTGGTLEVVWFPTPEAPDPIVDPTDPRTGIPNQYMRAFVAGILGLPAATRGRAFANLLQAIDSTLWAVDPFGGRTDQSLSVLVGHPLGLVRARLKLTAYGEVPQDESTQYVPDTSLRISGSDLGDNRLILTDPNGQIYASLGLLARGTVFSIVDSGGSDGVYTIVAASYDAQTIRLSLLEPLAAQIDGGKAILRAATGTLTTTAFDMRLGRADLFQDGLIGFFRDRDFSTLNVTHMPPDLPAAGYLEPIGAGNYLSATIWPERSTEPPAGDPVPQAEAASEFVSMLLDPRAAVHATTGILPAQSLDLPPVFYEEPLAQLEMSFRAGPIIVDVEAIRMPRPSEQYGTWSWVQKNTTGDGATAWAEDDITPIAERAQLYPMPQELRDGWMKLTKHDFTQK